jgi:hypothetical protein
MGRRLVIDDQYIDELVRGGSRSWERFTSDILSLSSGDIVELKRPIRRPNGGIYMDVRAYVAAYADRGYGVQALHPVDAEQICSVMGAGRYLEIGENLYTRKAA